MKPQKMFRWLVRVLFWLMLTAGSTPVHAAPIPPDPLVGDWLYFQDQPTTFNPDGTALRKSGEHGVWEYLHNSEVQRHYRIVWEQGTYVDTLILAEDGRHAHVRNEVGAHRFEYDVRRAVSAKTAPTDAVTPAVVGASLKGAPEVVDPLVGNWLWNQDNPVTIKGDGTTHNADGSEGTWEYLHNPELQRHYRIVWGHGRYVDEVVCSEDVKRAHIVNNNGTQFDVRRTRDDKAVGGPADSDDPIIGEWQWMKGSKVTFLADGTMASSIGLKGVWVFLHNPEPDREYRLDWKHGTYIDRFTYNRMTRTGHFTNQGGDSSDVTQGAAVASQPTATPSTPASYFGAPGH